MASLHCKNFVVVPSYTDPQTENAYKKPKFISNGATKNVTEDSMDHEEMEGNRFSYELAEWAISYDIKRTTLDELLRILREYGHDYLPSTAKRLFAVNRDKLKLTLKVAPSSCSFVAINNNRAKEHKSVEQPREEPMGKATSEERLGIGVDDNEINTTNLTNITTEATNDQNEEDILNYEDAKSEEEDSRCSNESEQISLAKLKEKKKVPDKKYVPIRFPITTLEQYIDLKYNLYDQSYKDNFIKQLLEYKDLVNTIEKIMSFIFTQDMLFKFTVANRPTKINLKNEPLFGVLIEIFQPKLSYKEVCSQLSYSMCLNRNRLNKRKFKTKSLIV